MNTVTISIITAVITALLTTLIKSWVDQLNYKNKLQKDLEFEHQRSVKNTISKFKGQLVDCVSALHNRLKYLAREEGYAKLENEFISKNDKILKSTLYRFLTVFASIHLINKEIIHFDPTKAHQDELILIKFFRILPLVFQDRDLENNMSKEYTRSSLIQRNVFEEMYKWLIDDNEIKSYTEFLNDYDQYEHHVQPLIDYLVDISPDCLTTRWDRLYTFHLLIMGFLNKFGYDFQHNDEGKMKKYIERQGQYDMFKNIDRHLIQKFKLSEVEEVKKILKIAKYYK